jgi:hypothetical protein
MCQRLSMPGAPPVPGVSKRASGAQPPSRAPVSAARCRRRTGVRAGRPGRSATTSGTALLRRISSTHHRISSARLGLTKVRPPRREKRDDPLCVQPICAPLWCHPKHRPLCVLRHHHCKTAPKLAASLMGARQRQANARPKLQ